MPVILFFVRVNQVLVRLWARAMEAGYPRVRPAVWLMSDREIRGVCQSMSRKPLCQAASVQRRLCELIRMMSVLLKEWAVIRVLCRDD